MIPPARFPILLCQGTYLRTAFTGNRIPSSRLNPIGLNIASYYPLPNTGRTRGDHQQLCQQCGYGSEQGSGNLPDRSSDHGFAADIWPRVARRYGPVPAELLWQRCVANSGYGRLHNVAESKRLLGV